MAPLRTVLITTALALTTAVAHADSSVYIGAGVDRGHVSDIYHTGEIPGLGPFFHIDNATAWDAIIGLRPVQPFAVEATYIDLGSDTYHWNNGQVSYNAHAAALYAIGFLPLPLPHLEVYGKAGLAQWQLNGKTYISIVPPRSDEATQRLGRWRATALRPHRRSARIRPLPDRAGE